MAIPRLANEKQLLAKIANGDGHAFKVVYDCYYPHIYRFAFRILQSRSLAQEVLQETMLKLWQLGDQLHKIEYLEAWLHQVARHHAIDLLRKSALTARVQAVISDTFEERHNETEERILLNETRKILEEGIRQLPRQQHLVYQLCQQQGMKYEEVAALLNISHGTVQTHMKLALKSLRRYMQEHSDIAVLLIILRLL
ncbi:RNA polymerase sigma-70 factor, ECF subfamily [Chitinophaga jiangningensis]|uniref:RNA polymerase sigma-70 factor, ECF subfamily n=1 Tax=Chitinophaga jiangningensis TaxID=1419482 RepID=A0A1M7C4N5_9BACT|nr:RNA polymerase sigma-70 factor [Chitinophaga jiangningensis]SHL62174.1 RNA polymerase sigma-70 factor, ECF subfamily [Chitinophaga jiangningensis]